MTERLKRRAAMHAFCTLDMEGTSEGVGVIGRSRMWTTTSGKTRPSKGVLLRQLQQQNFLPNHHRIVLLHKKQKWECNTAKR